MQRAIRYSLAKVSDCLDQDGAKIQAFTLRSTDGTDEAYAAKRADAKGTQMSEELIRYSIVSYEIAGPTVNGTVTNDIVKATQPFEGFDRWSTKARNFVVAAWRKLATPDEAELADFFASASEA